MPAPSRSYALHHVGINVASIEDSLGFYRDTLGMCEVRRWKAGERQGSLDGLDLMPGFDVGKTDASVAYLSLGDFFVELVEYRAPLPSAMLGATAPNSIGRTHLCFRCDDLRALYLELQDEVRFLSRPVMSSTGGLMVKCLDPSGNVVEFAEDPTADREGQLRIDHLGLNVRDLGSAISFFETLFGWSVARRYQPRLSVDAFVSGIAPDQSVSAIAFLDAGGGTQVELLEYPRAASVLPAQHDVGCTHLGVRVGDFEAAVREVGQLMPWIGSTQQSSTGTKTVKGRGTDGSTIELIDPGSWLLESH